MIDWNRVTELRAEIGPKDFREVATLFLEEADAVVAGLKRSPDTARLEAELHSLKGSAFNLGFQRLGELCEAGERQASAGRAGEVDLVPIFASYETSRTEFLANDEGLPVTA